MGAQLSLICAIYKVREYIPDLIDSLIRGANHPEVQIIFVNDCTPDDSMLLCKSLLAARSSEIRFCVKMIDRDHNGGVAAARNSGLAAADAAYIGFIDADDAVDGHYFEVLRPLVVSNEWDVVEFAYTEFVGELPESRGAAGRRMSSSQLNPFHTGFFLWTRVFRTEILAGLTFPEGTVYEDVRFVSEAFARIRSSTRISNRLIFYRRRPGSITAQRDQRYAQQLANLVAGASAGVVIHQRPAKAIELTARKALVILLKGGRISDQVERSRFFSLCQEPLDQIATLIVNHCSRIGLGRIWLTACHGWLGLQRISGRA